MRCAGSPIYGLRMAISEERKGLDHYSGWQVNLTGRRKDVKRQVFNSVTTTMTLI